MVEHEPLADRDIQIGGQYLFWVRNPKRPFLARGMILGHDIDTWSGRILYRFVRADTSRRFQPRPASEFFRIPADWQDPTDDLGEGTTH
jgi:hypothetical protein